MAAFDIHFKLLHSLCHYNSIVKSLILVFEASLFAIIILVIFDCEH